MQITMNDQLINSISQLRRFLEGTQKVGFSLEGSSVEERYLLIDRMVDQLGYALLSKRNKHLVVRYLRKLTGYKNAQLYRLIKRASEGELLRKEYHRVNPSVRYTPFDIALLEETDIAHKRMNSLATKEILRREYEVYGKKEYQNISKVSASHINNLRKTEHYKRKWEKRTHPVPSTIGKTMKPESFGFPGSIRVDTVHQRNIYYLNAVDEATQWEVVVCVPKLTSKYLEKALTLLLAGFPFEVTNFHSDKGGEFINQSVALALSRALITQTKSRSYHCNDNALVESKNASVVRKTMGHHFVEKEMSASINTFCQDWLTPYANFHRPCVYVTKITFSKNGRRKLHYGGSMTPYNKLKQIVKRTKNQNQHSETKPKILKKNITLKKLDTIELKFSDNEFAKRLRKAHRKLHKQNKNSPISNYLKTKL